MTHISEGKPTFALSDVLFLTSDDALCVLWWRPREDVMVDSRAVLSMVVGIGQHESTVLILSKRSAKVLSLYIAVGNRFLFGRILQSPPEIDRRVEITASVYHLLVVD